MCARRQVTMPSLELSAEETVAVQLDALRQNDMPWYACHYFVAKCLLALCCGMNALLFSFVGTHSPCR